MSSTEQSEIDSLHTPLTDRTFWQAPLPDLDNYIVDGLSKQKVSYRELEQRITSFSAKLPNKKSLIALVAINNVAFVVAYIACLRARHTILIVEPDQAEQDIKQLKSQVAIKEESLLSLYQAQFLVENEHIYPVANMSPELAPDLALLLSTSGSTGTSKYIKLTFQNLQSNCHAILSYLPLASSDTVHLSLPLSYSFGLSILHTHLAIGSTIVLHSFSPFEREYWQQVQAYPPTTFYGVPFSIEALVKLGLKRLKLDSIRLFAVAGGKVATSTCQQLAEWTKAHDKTLYLMYGQTEATARIAFLSPDKVGEKPSAIGKAIPGGRLRLLNEAHQEIRCEQTPGELFYQGPNVFGGYANNKHELASINHHEWLATGDIAQFDADGDFSIVGRIKRIIKLSGKRYNLDEMESSVNDALAKEIKLTQENDRLIVHVLAATAGTHEDLIKRISDILSISVHIITVKQHDNFPRLANGKINYQVMHG